MFISPQIPPKLLFAILDCNKNGQISIEETFNNLKQRRIQERPDILNQFATMDMNRDGFRRQNLKLAMQIINGI